MLNQRLSDTCLIDRVAGMGRFDWLAGDALSITWWCLEWGERLDGSLIGFLVGFNRRPSDAQC